MPALRIAIDQAAQLALQRPRGAARHLLHARPVDLAGFVQGNGERFRRRLDMRDRVIALQRPPLEDGGLRGALGLGIVVFKGE